MEAEISWKQDATQREGWIRESSMCITSQYLEGNSCTFLLFPMTWSINSKHVNSDLLETRCCTERERWIRESSMYITNQHLEGNSCTFLLFPGRWARNSKHVNSNLLDTRCYREGDKWIRERFMHVTKQFISLDTCTHSSFHLFPVTRALMPNRVQWPWISSRWTVALSLTTTSNISRFSLQQTARIGSQELNRLLHPVAPPWCSG